MSFFKDVIKQGKPRVFLTSLFIYSFYMLALHYFKGELESSGFLSTHLLFVFTVLGLGVFILYILWYLLDQEVKRRVPRVSDMILSGALIASILFVLTVLLIM